MKQFFHTVMMWVAALGTAYAAGEPCYTLDDAEQVGAGVRIRFAEPLVAASEVRQYGKPSIDIQASAGPKPSIYWTDQNEFLVHFADGTEPGTSYRLELCERLHTYLSGKPVPQTVIEFKAPPCRVEKVDEPGHSWGIPGGAVLLKAQQSYYCGSDYPALPGVKYSFVLTDEQGEPVREVPGKARVAKVRELPEMLVAISLRKASREECAALSPDSSVPGMVMVEPVENLSGCRWRLKVEHPHVAVCSSGISGKFPQELICVPELKMRKQDGRGRLYMELCFSAPVAVAELEKIFHSLTIASGEHVAESVPGTCSKLLQLEGQVIRFTYEPLPEYFSYERRGEFFLKQPRRLTSRVGMWVDGAQHLPVPLQLTLPEGTQAAGGLSMKKAQVIPFALNPSLPTLSEDVATAGGMMLMPLHGEHRLKLHCYAAGSLMVRVARLDAGQYLNLYRYLDLLQFVKHYSDNEIREKLEPLFGAEKKFLVPESADGMQEVELPLNEVEGFGKKPGVYVIAVKACPVAGPPPLRENEEEPFCPEIERFYVLQLTDLMAYTLGDKVLALRRSDGAPVQKGEVSIYGDIQEDNANRLMTFPLRDGLAELSATDDFYIEVALLQSGEDFVHANISSLSMTSGEENRTGCVSLFTDRSLYRPGELLHLCAVVRQMGAEGNCMLPPAGQEVEVAIRQGDKLCHEQKLKLDDYGSAYLDWRLPKEPEEAVGEYILSVNAEGCTPRHLDVQCEEFRRDSFEVQSELVVEPVRPSRAVLRVRATGYDGLPVTDALLKAEVSIGNDDYTVELPLDESGCALHEVELKRRNEWLEGKSVLLRVEGSVCNSRQEYVELPVIVRELYPADFSINFAIRHNQLPMIFLRTAADEELPLERAQELKLSLFVPVYVDEPQANGMVIATLQENCVWQQKLTVPAHCREGVHLDLAPVLHQLMLEAEKKKTNHRFSRCRLKVAGTDSAGNCIEEEIFLPLHRDEFNLPGAGEELNYNAFSTGGVVRAQLQGRELVVPTDFRRSGKAAVVFSSQQGCCVDTVQVQAGVQQLRLSLPENMHGNVVGQLLLPGSLSGSYKRAESLRFDARVPRTEKLLSVDWQLPPGVQSPGRRVKVGGRVLAPDGSPVARAAVCLWAVDAGMLSVSRYTLPQPWAVFEGFHDRAFSVFYRLAEYSYTLPNLSKVGELEVAPYYRYMPLPLCWEENDEFFSLIHKRAGYYSTSRNAFRARALAEVDSLWGEGGGLGSGLGGSDTPPPLRLRTDFTPTPLWLPALRTDEEGHFSAELPLPDTFTTYRVMAVVQGEDGCSFGNSEAELVVNQPVMLEPGTPLFMSVGDTLSLPVTVTNNTGAEGTWVVSMQGADATQQVTLAAGQSATLYFDFTAASEGECLLQWQAVGANGSDAVQGCFPVRFPAPVLQEAHHVALRAGDSALVPAELLAPELRNGRNLSMEVELCADPLAQLRGCLEFSLEYPYGCTEQRSSTLLPWLLHKRLAPYCPAMKNKSAEDVKAVVSSTVRGLLMRQQKDGGLSYWDSGESCYWASAQAALVLTLAQEQGYDVPAQELQQLRDYLMRELAKQKEPGAFTRYAVGRACDDVVIMDAALTDEDALQTPASYFHSRPAMASLRLLADLRCGKANYYSAYNRWLRTVCGGGLRWDTWNSGWVFLALYEFLRTTPHAAATQATLCTACGREISIGHEPVTLSAAEAATLTPIAGTAYVTIKAKALPEQTEYPGVTEKGLQVTRIYEKRGEDGVWREAREFNVGDVVRVTLTCAKGDRELEYFVLEDYLPSCMEAINPNVPSQAAGLEWRPWSYCFDHKEYLSHRVRGFCTRWGGRDLLNMSYYARVKRAGVTTAPPAQAQLMYEPQTYGLSPNAVITTR